MPFERFRQERQCYRIAPGGFDGEGKYSPGARDPFTINASLQPSTSTDLLVLEEGLRNRKSFTLFYESENPLQMVKPGTSQMPDIVVYNGEEYDCVSTMPWRNTIINHYKSIIQKAQNNPGGGGGAPAP